MNSLIQKIDRIIEERSLLNHPFYQTWSDGKLTHEALAGYSKEYYQLVKAVPIFMTQLLDYVPESLYDELDFNQKEEFSQYANERLFKELLPIFDNFERALEDTSNDTKSLKEGLEMILKQFSSFLEKERVEPIEAIGEKFDPMIHEVLTSEESSEHEENTIISQFVKGYMINNRVIRPSQVVISKKPSLESEEVLTKEPEESPDKEESPTD